MSQENLPSSWDAFASGNASTNQQTDKASGGGGLFMTLKQREQPYAVRLVSAPEPFRQHWNAFKPLQNKPVISPVFDVADKDKDYAWSVGGYVPVKKYAILVIDREDGKVKIMQGGEQIFGRVREYIDSQKKLKRDADPTGPNATDWLITVGQKEGQTHYTCNPDTTGAKPLTPEEAAAVAALKIDWRTSFFKKPSPEEIKAMWERLPEDKKYNPEPKGKGKTADGAAVQNRAPQVNAAQLPPTPAPVVQAAAPVAATPPATPPAAQAVVTATTTQAPQPAKLF